LHWLQLDWPLAGCAEPGSHKAHEVRDPSEKRPAGHGEQDVAPSVTLSRPGWQLTQAVSPDTLEKRPTAHCKASPRIRTVVAKHAEMVPRHRLSSMLNLPC
jgi:hypothetical protein